MEHENRRETQRTNLHSVTEVPSYIYRTFESWDKINTQTFILTYSTINVKAYSMRRFQCRLCIFNCSRSRHPTVSRPRASHSTPQKHCRQHGEHGCTRRRPKSAATHDKLGFMTPRPA